MATSLKRIKQVVEVRERLGRAVADLEWAYRGLYYGNDAAPSFDHSRTQAERAARDLLDLLPNLSRDVGRA